MPGMTTRYFMSSTRSAIWLSAGSSAVGPTHWIILPLMYTAASLISPRSELCVASSCMCFSRMEPVGTGRAVPARVIPGMLLACFINA